MVSVFWLRFYSFGPYLLSVLYVSFFAKSGGSQFKIMFYFCEMVACESYFVDSSKVIAPSHPFSDSYFMDKFFGVFPSDRKTQSLSLSPKCQDEQFQN